METKILALPRFPFFSYEEIAPWLTEALNPQQVEDFLGYLGLYPQTLPTQSWQLVLIQAALKVKIRKEKKTEQNNDKFFIPNEILPVSRSLAEAVSIFLDGQEPAGISEIYLKKDNQNVLLATSVAFEGKIDFLKKEKIGEIELDFGLKERQKIDVLPDEVVFVPQAGTDKVRLKIKTFGKVRIAGKRKISHEAQSGKVGIVIDGRGRPLVPPTPDEEGRKRLLLWQEVFLREF